MNNPSFNIDDINKTIKHVNYINISIINIRYNIKVLII